MQDRSESGRGRIVLHTVIVTLTMVGVALGASVLPGGGGVAAATASAMPAATASPAKARASVVSVSTASAQPLAAAGEEVVQSIVLTKGTWTVMAAATAIDPGSSDFFRCALVDTTNATALDGATTFLNASILRDVITNLATVKVKGRVTVSQECGHDGASGDAGSIDAGASLVGFVTPPSAVRVGRSTSQTPLSTHGDVEVVDLTLPKGTWVLAAKLTPVVLSAASVAITCSDDSEGGAQRTLGTEAGLHAASTIFKVGATVTLSKPTEFALACGAGADGSYVDPGAVFWAWKASNLQRTDSVTCPVTLTGTGAADALVASQSAFCDIASGTFPSQLVGATLKPGTWVAFGALNALDSKGANTARCELRDATHGKQLALGSASESATQNVSITGIADLAVVTVKKSVEVDASCGQDAAGAPAVTAGSEWAFIKP